MEDLHAIATRLKHLKLDDVSLRTEAAENNNNQVIYQPLENLESFSLIRDLWNPIQEEGEEGTEEESEIAASITIRSGIKYIGMKYPQLCDLNKDFIGENVNEKDLKTTHFINCLKDKRHLKIFSTNISFSKQPIRALLKDNGIQLQHFGFSIDIKDPIKEIFTSMQTCQPVSTISSLSVDCHTGITDSSVQQSLTDLCSDLKYLTELNIENDHSSCTPMLLVEIFKNLTMLKSLEFGFLLIDEQMENDDLFYNTPFSTASNVHFGKIESVCLAGLDIYDGRNGVGDSILKSNILFSFILQSCPYLKKIVIQADDVNASGAINLDFRENHCLQHIDVDLMGYKYHTFDDEPGEYWIMKYGQQLLTQMTDEDIIGRSYSKFSVSLALNRTKNIKLILGYL